MASTLLTEYGQAAVESAPFAGADEALHLAPSAVAANVDDVPTPSPEFYRGLTRSLVPSLGFWALLALSIHFIA
jgi:hypothetical protein